MNILNVTFLHELTSADIWLRKIEYVSAVFLQLQFFVWGVADELIIITGSK